MQLNATREVAKSEERAYDELNNEDLGMSSGSDSKR